MKSISKIEAAARQLDTAIDLYFDNADSLSVYTLAYASFKILFDLYPHRKNDNFAAQIDEIITIEGWKRMSQSANFLKHADRDPDTLLESHHPDQGLSIIGFATILYRRIASEFTPKMRAFDFCTETIGYDDLGIEEVDENEERVERDRRVREAIRAMPRDQRIVFAQKQYRFFIENYERIDAIVKEGQASGLTITEIMDQYFLGAENAAD